MNIWNTGCLVFWSQLINEFQVADLRYLGPHVCTVCITSRPDSPILPKRGHLRVCPLNIPVLAASDFVANLWGETHLQLGPTSHQMDQSAQGWNVLHEGINRLRSRRS